MSMYHFSDTEAVEHDVNAVPAFGDLRQAMWNQTPGMRREHIMSHYARRIREALGVDDG